MLKRFRKFRGDTDKPNSPPGSPTHGDRGDTGQPDGSGLNLSQQSWDDSTTEGFLCPLCMNKFPSPEILQQHFETAHDDTADKQSQNTPSPAHDSGFLCPQCKEALPSGAALEAHFASKHGMGLDTSTTANRDGDVLALRQEIDDLRTTLKEEKWYSTELRKEMEKFQGSATPGGATDEEKVELDLIRQQLRASEESRILLSSEVGHLREQLADATAAKTSIQEAKTMIEQKAAKLSGEIVGAKARVDEIEGQRAGFEDHIRTLTEQLAERNRYVRGLESQLAQRPGADDVLVLRQELVHAQTLMDQMTQDQEKEKQKLEEEHARLKADFNKSESKLQDLQQMLHSAPRVEEIEALKATMAATSSSSEELHKIISDKEATIIEKVRNMEQLKVGLQEQVALIQTKEILLTEVQRNLAERNASLEEIKIQLKGTEAELVSRKEEVARLEERSKLMDSQTQEKGVTIDKIQAERSKTETLNNTLQAEKLRLAKDLEAAKLSFNQKEAELKEMSDSLIQLQQQIEKRDAKISEREKNMEDLEGKLAETRQNAQASSYEKDQQFTSLRAELEKTVSGLRQQEASSSDLQKHIADLQRQLQAEAQRVEEGRAHVRERDATLEEERRQAEVKVAKVRELEEMLGKVKDNVGRLEEERADLIAKIEAGEGVNTAINQLKQENSVLQERLSGAESNSEHVAKEHQEKVDDLHKQLQDAKATLHEITETSAKIEDSLKVNQEKLEETKVKVTQLEGDLQTKSELLLAAEMAKTTQRADLENHIKTVQNALDEKVNEVSKVKGQLDQVRQEHGEDSARALRLEVTVKEQTTTTNSLQQKVVALEADVAERSASLEQLKVGKAALQEDLQGQVDTALVKVAKTQTALVKSGETLRAVQAEKKTLEDELKGKRVDAKKLLEEHHKLEVEHHKKVEEFKKLEQGKRSVETQLKVAQDTISEKTAQLEKTQGTLESSMAKLKDQHTRSCAEATSVQSKLKQQIESLESNRMQLLEEKTKVTLTLEDTQAALTSCKHDLAGIKTALEKEKASSELTSSDLTQKAVHLDGLLTSYKEELVTQQGMMDKKVKVINDLQSEISELNATKLSLEQKVTKTEGMVACTMKELNEKGELLVRVKDDGSKKEESLKKELKEAAIREGKVQSLLDEAHAQGRHLEEQVQAGKGALAVLETANAATRKELSQQINASEENSKQATKTLEEVHEAKKNVENKLTDVKSQLQEVTSHRDELKQNQDTLKKTLIDQQQLYQDLGEAKGSLERELHATVTTAQKDKVDSDRELKEHKEARELLIGQKVELQAQVTSLGTTLATLRTQYDESREEADTVQAQLRAESSELQGKLVSLEEARLAVVRDKEQWTAQHELQVAAMHENLATIRGDMATAQKRLAEADKANEDLRGEKLELEAKLDNNNGERRSLLERCLTSEAEVQQLQEKVTEVRRKLDNAQAALHELGRENQSLQIFTNKASSRKWADDNEVTYCMSCNKGFSMTVRKHHCRHCGNIFCNECSAKQATVAASKKPVRVCDSCYTDLTSRS